MPFREKRLTERVFSQPVPLSRPASGADWRKSARLFAHSSGVHHRDGLTAEGTRIQNRESRCHCGSRRVRLAAARRRIEKHRLFRRRALGQQGSSDSVRPLYRF